MKSRVEKITRTDDDTVRIAVTATAIQFDVEVSDIMGRRRFETLVLARMTAYWLLKEVAGMRYSRIAEAFGRHHGAIISGVKRVKGLIEIKCNFDRFHRKLKASRRDFEEMAEKYGDTSEARKREELDDALRVV